MLGRSRSTDVALLPELLPAAYCADLARRLVRSRLWRRRDLVVPTFDTARRLSVLDPDCVDEAAPGLADLYLDPDFQTTLAGAAETDGLVEPVPHSIERYVVNRMDRPGDIHGGHFDDYPIAATILLATECVQDDAAWVIDERGERRLVNLLPGYCYVLRASAVWHGVGPVTVGGRIAVTFAFGLRGHSVSVTESAQLIYGRDGNADDNHPVSIT